VKGSLAKRAYEENVHDDTDQIGNCGSGHEPKEEEGKLYTTDS